MKAETRRLLDKAEHAIRAAEILLDAEERDFAVGRAYYAMFYVAEALLVERGKRFLTRGGAAGLVHRQRTRLRRELGS